MRQTPGNVPADRRGFLIRVIQTVHASIGATLAFVVGGAVVAPSFSRRERLWLPAGSVPQLTDGVPTAVTLRIVRSDGASETVDRRVVYLVKNGNDLRALDSTCTHLGCRTKFNAETGKIECRIAIDRCADLQTVLTVDVVPGVRLDVVQVRTRQRARDRG